MAILKIMAIAKDVKHLEVLKEKLERDYGPIFADGPIPDRGGQGYKMYYTVELPNDV